MKACSLILILLLIPLNLFSMRSEKSGYSSSDGSLRGGTFKKRERSRSMLADQELGELSGSISSHSSDSEDVQEVDTRVLLEYFYAHPHTGQEPYFNAVHKRVERLKHDAPSIYITVAQALEQMKHNEKKKIKFSKKFFNKVQKPTSLKMIVGTLVNSALLDVESEKREKIKRSRQVCMGAYGSCSLCLLICTSVVVSSVLPIIASCYV